MTSTKKGASNKMTRQLRNHPHSICTCGHVGDGPFSNHEDTLNDGHGPCKKCPCRMFMWHRYMIPFEERRFLTRQLLNAAKTSAEKQGVSLLACIPYPHPGDANLAKVLCITSEHEEFVVWTYNMSNGGFHSGIYFADIRDAMTQLTLNTVEMYQR